MRTLVLAACVLACLGATSRMAAAQTQPPTTATSDQAPGGASSYAVQQFGGLQSGESSSGGSVQSGSSQAQQSGGVRPAVKVSKSQ